MRVSVVKSIVSSMFFPFKDEVPIYKRYIPLLKDQLYRLMTQELIS